MLEISRVITSVKVRLSLIIASFL